MGYETLQGLFATHLVELAAKRRNHKPGYTGIRVFLATNNKTLLSGIAGKTALGFIPPKRPGASPYHHKTPKELDLLITYDLWMQGFRSINLRDYMIRGVLPLKTKQDIEDFWAYYAYILKPLSWQEKIQVLDNRGDRVFTVDGIQEYMQKQREERERLMQYDSLTW